MINQLKIAAKKYIYLFIAAAWLYTISFIITNYFTTTTKPASAQKKIEQRLHRFQYEINSFLKEDNKITALINKNPSDNKDLLNKNYGLFIYQENELNFWNTNKIFIDDKDLMKPDGIHFVTYQNGNFILSLSSKTLNGNAIRIAAILPIYWDYFIENKYLSAHFDELPELNEQFRVSHLVNENIIKDINGASLFSIEPKDSATVSDYDIITILCRLVSILLLLFFLNKIAHQLQQTINFKVAFIFLFSTVLILRLLFFFTNFPFNKSRLTLFDPTIYASSFLLPSLGDLFINAIFLYWLLGFYRTAFFKQVNATFKKSGLNYIIPNISVLAVSTLLITSVIRSLIDDSKISFDVANFFSLDIFTVVSFLILSFLVLAFSRLSKILLRPIIEKQVSLTRQLVFTCIIGILLSILRYVFLDSNLIIDIIATGWLCIYILFYNLFKKDLYVSLQESPNFIIRVLFFALSIAILVFHESNQVELKQRQKNAERLSLQEDTSGENMLGIATSNFTDSFLQKNFNRFKTEYTGKFIKDSLINENFSGYLNKYVTTLYVFDSDYKGINNEDSTSYASFKTTLINLAQETKISGLYSLNTYSNRQSYIYTKQIHAGGKTIGYLFVTTKPKRFKREALYPELFTQSKDISVTQNSVYSYAIYYKGKLVDKSGEYSYPSRAPSLHFINDFAIKNNNGYNEVWYTNNDGKIILFAKKRQLWIDSLTLVAYLFCSFLFIMFSFRIGNALLNKKSLYNFNFWKQLNIRMQIQGTIIFLSLFSFIIIGVVTISFFIDRFNKGNQQKLSSSIQIMSTETGRILNAQLSFDDVITVNDLGTQNSIEKKLIEISEIHNVEVNFFSINGQLQTSTQPYIFNKHLLNNKIHPAAYNALRYNNATKFVQTEKIGKFSFISIYAPVINDSGELYGFLNIPYLNSQYELNQEISGFLANLINLNAIIFLLAGGIAFILTNSITSSFNIISKKMNAIALGKINEEISWQQNDEIGSLVKEYNKMVQKLGESAKALAQSEREGAWREMARQVAHEIKNPLTPMKLSIQYLQQAITNNSPNVKELAYKVSNTLIEQIEQLAKIASDFSQFANIGNTQPEIFDIKMIIENCYALYQSNPNITINRNYPTAECKIYADKIQISRLFTNLLQNSVEAVNENQKVNISIKIEVIAEKYRIVLEDESGGIPEGMHHKIFTPNFTTKSAGTGLGLAICKGIIEKANGQISFVSKEGIGTAFKILLPIAE